MLKGKRRSFWRCIPLHIKAIICCAAAFLFFILFLLLMLASSTDSYLNDIDATSQHSSQAFSIKWEDNTTQEIYDFNNGENPRSVSSIYLIAKKETPTSGISIGSTKLTNTVTGRVIAKNLPVTVDSETKNEDVELCSFTMEQGSTLNNLIFDETVIPKDLQIAIEFDTVIELEFISVEFKEIQV